MKLTRERLPKMCQWAWAGGELKEQEVRDLLKFAETMLPVRDALLELAEAKATMYRTAVAYTRGKEYGPVVDEAIEHHGAMMMAFWKAARKLAETDAEVEP